MPDIGLDAVTLKAVLTLLITAAALYGFVSERLAPDVTALLALLLTGVLTPYEAFTGFSHQATISVAAVLVLSAGVERTRALTFIEGHRSQFGLHLGRVFGARRGAR